MRFCAPVLFIVSLFVSGCSGETEEVTKHSNGTIASRGYLDSDGAKNGDWTEWNSDGNKIYTLRFKNGKREGPMTMWNKDGSIIGQYHYKNDKKEGRQTNFSWDGSYKVDEVHYENGKKDGEDIVWNKEGQIIGKLRWVDGKQDGVQTIWIIKGGIREKKLEEVWENGQLVSTTQVFSDGISWLTVVLVLCGIFLFMRSEIGKIFVKRATEEAVKNWKKYIVGE
jgi:antitoxin component YwqK of YwqJK toxin-antitoxin module